ncbi:PARP10_14_15 [Mytilus coruscus]|uniref:PARP10_14_15 n=1 Tax=Mytilus coruscus TaxID=42192 RepID=A0A6J8DG01_MYTCO|nr:PARP10_14_15 [Mytilus coruscus]
MDRDSENQNLINSDEDYVDPEGNISESESIDLWNPPPAPNIIMQKPVAHLDSDEQRTGQDDHHRFDLETHQTYGSNYNVPTQWPQPFPETGESYGCNTPRQRIRGHTDGLHNAPRGQEAYFGHDPFNPYSPRIPSLQYPRYQQPMQFQPGPYQQYYPSPLGMHVGPEYYPPYRSPPQPFGPHVRNQRFNYQFEQAGSNQRPYRSNDHSKQNVTGSQNSQTEIAQSKQKQNAKPRTKLEKTMPPGAEDRYDKKKKQTFVPHSQATKKDNEEKKSTYMEEGRAKADIIAEEFFRTEDDLGHAIVAFHDKFDINAFTKACESRKIKECSLVFEELDPPRSAIISFDDEPLSENSLKTYLRTKNLVISRIRKTEAGLYSVKFKNEQDLDELVKFPKIMIDGNRITTSVAYNCSHGTFWDQSLHTVSIPVPFKPCIEDPNIRSYITDITSVCNELLEKHHARLILKDEIVIECTLNSKEKDIRQKVKQWTKDIQKAWEDCIVKNVKKRELHITADTKELFLRHVNESKETHKSDDLKIIIPEESVSMTIIFIGKCDIVESFYNQVYNRLQDIEETINREKKLTSGSVILKPTEVKLLLKENKLEKLNDIAFDFKYEVDQVNGVITFRGILEDIERAKHTIYTEKNSYYIWTMKNLSYHCCELLQNTVVANSAEKKLSDIDISATFDVKHNEIVVCTSEEENENVIEDILRKHVVERTIQLDDSNKHVLQLSDWETKCTALRDLFNDVCTIDDSEDIKLLLQIQDFIKEHTTDEDTINVTDESQFRFLKLHCMDWLKELEVKYSDNRLKIKFEEQSIKVQGTKDGIKTAKLDIDIELSKIQKELYKVSKTGLHLLFKDPDTVGAFLGPIDEDSRTVVAVNITNSSQSRNSNTKLKETDDEYTMRQAFEDMKRYDRKRSVKKKSEKKKPIEKPMSKKGSVVFINGTTVHLIKKEDLGKQKANVIVCSSNGDLDLSGPVGKSIVKVAGNELLAEIKNKYTGGIKHGDIAVAKGYKLQCTELYLAALFNWKPGFEKVLSKCVTSCLQRASTYTSIVFPALGTGNFNYPRDIVAKTMYDCVHQFDLSNTSLKDIRFLCYDNDTIGAFEREEMLQLNPNRESLPEWTCQPTYYQLKNISVSVVVGNIGTQQVDILVAAGPKNLFLQKSGGAGMSLIHSLGVDIQQDITKQYPKGVQEGEMACVELSSHIGCCKVLYLTSLNAWNEQEKVKDNDKQIYKFVNNCLVAAEKDGYRSIAFPALGTGNLHYPCHLVAKYMFDIVEQFARNKQKTTLSYVYFVVYEKDAKVIQAFKEEERKRVPGLHSVNVKSIAGNVFQIGNLQLSVEKGDILSKTCDAMLYGSNEELDFTKGNLSRELNRRCNTKKLQSECSNKKSKMKWHGIITTSGCGLPAKFIFHVCSKHRPDDWKSIIKKSFYKAERKQLKTLSLPAFGTGAQDPREELMGKVIAESILEFVKEGQTTHLQHIYLIIFQDKMVQPMLKAVRFSLKPDTMDQYTLAKGNLALREKNVQKQHLPVLPVVDVENTNQSSVTFTIYFQSGNDLSVAKTMLEQAISEKYQTEKQHDGVIAKLTQNEADYLKAVENRHAVIMTVDKVKCDVIIKGLVDEDTDDKGLPTLEKYPDMINMYLETAYKGDSGRTEVEFRDDQGEEYVIVLREMTEYLKNDRSNKVDVLRREKLQGDGGSFEPPSEWAVQGSDNVKVVTLMNTSQEFKTIEKMFLDSVFGGRKEWVSQFKKQSSKITKIERIQNLSLYQMYTSKKGLIEKQNPSGTANEQELWYSAFDASVVSINLYGFNRSYCGDLYQKTKLKKQSDKKSDDQKDNPYEEKWGEGVYFSSEAGFAILKGIDSGENSTTTDRTIYMCKVLTGVHKQGIAGMRYLPMRQDGTMMNYDSATDDCKPPVQFVIFNDTQAYPQYCIRFRL